MDDQFAEVLSHFGIKVDDSDLMSRCSKCNGDGYILLSPEQASRTGQVPQRVLDLQPPLEFWACRNEACGKVYWEGPRFFDARDRFEAMLDSGGAPGERGGAGDEAADAGATAADGDTVGWVPASAVEDNAAVETRWRVRPPVPPHADDASRFRAAAEDGAEAAPAAPGTPQ